MKADPPLTNGDFKSKIERVKAASKRLKAASKEYMTLVKKQNIPILDIGLTDKPGKGNLSWNVLSYNPAEKKAIDFYKTQTKKLKTARTKHNKK